jgi:DNA primase small subunit
MNESELRFLRSVYSEYYLKHSNLIEVPPPVSKREIGFVVGNEKVMKRHMSFQDNEAIRKYILDNLPWDAFHSCSVYEFPENPIDKKNVIWSEIAFDIDAKDLGCQGETYWVCDKCGEVFKKDLQKCSSCGNELREVNFIASTCIEKTYEKTKELALSLVEDFGVNENEIKVFYSGHMGFHVYVDSQVFREISQDERREIIDFLLLNELQPNFFVLFSQLQINKVGVGRRIASNVVKIIESPSSYAFLDEDSIKKIEQRKKELISSVSEGSLKLALSLLGQKILKRIVQEALSMSRIPIDPSVTLDEHRIIRMPGTINSKSGFPKFEVSLSEKVYPLDLLPTYGEKPIKLKVRIAPPFRVRGETFKELHNTEEEVPRFYAAYLVSKGVAQVV